MIGLIQKYGFSISLYSGTFQAWFLLNNGSVQLLALMKNYVSYLVLRERKGYDNVSKGAHTETLDSKGYARQNDIPSS